MNARTLSRAEAAFKKEQKAIEARIAWQDYESKQAATDANTMRLRALRLAREAAPAIKKKRAARA